MSTIQAKFSCPGCSHENEIVMPPFSFKNITFADSKTYEDLQ
jgi:hypothetical protein